jgi:hypothetical protein
MGSNRIRYYYDEMKASGMSDAEINKTIKEMIASGMSEAEL